MGARITTAGSVTQQARIFLNPYDNINIELNLFDKFLNINVYEW